MGKSKTQVSKVKAFMQMVFWSIMILIILNCNKNHHLLNNKKNKPKKLSVTAFQEFPIPLDVLKKKSQVGRKSYILEEPINNKKSATKFSTLS